MTGKRQDVILTLLAQVWPNKMSANALVSKFKWNQQTKADTIKLLESREFIENFSEDEKVSQYQLTPKGWRHAHTVRQIPVKVEEWECYLCEAVIENEPVPVLEDDKLIRSCPSCGDEWMGIPHGQNYSLRRSQRKGFAELYEVMKDMGILTLRRGVK